MSGPSFHRRRFLALLGLAPVAVPAALAAAVRPAAPFLVAGADVTTEGTRLVLTAHDGVSETIRAIAARHGLTVAELTGDFSTVSFSTLARAEALRTSLRPETATRGSAGAVAGAVRTSPLGRFLPTTGRGLRAPASFGADPAGPSSPSAWAWAGLQNQAPGVRLPPAVPSVGRA